MLVIATLPVRIVRNEVGTIVAADAIVTGALLFVGFSAAQSDATIGMLVPHRHCECINVRTCGRIADISLHSNHHVEDFRRSHATRRTTNLENLTSVSSVEADGEN